MDEYSHPDESSVEASSESSPEASAESADVSVNEQSETKNGKNTSVPYIAGTLCVLFIAAAVVLIIFKFKK
jgi:hypothetical protein